MKRTRCRRTTRRPTRALARFSAEGLEGRTLLAATPANVFAQFDGVAGPNTASTVRIHLAPQDFAIGKSQVTLGFAVTAAAGSGLSPEPVEVRPAGGGGASEVDAQAGLTGNSSLTLAKLNYGDYDLVIAGSGGTAGAWSLQVSLTGDVNGDFLVDAADLALLKDAKGQPDVGPEFLAVGDADRDGRITGFDSARAENNQGSSTSVRVLAITAGLDPNSDTGVPGDNVVNKTPVNVIGRANPGARIALDKDGDGFDDGSTVAATTAGSVDYALPAPLAAGLNTIRVQALDSFGQREVASTQITLDPTPPTIAGSRTPAANPYGWNSTNVVVSFAASDGQSGLASVTPPVTLGTEGAGQSVAGTATDRAGNVASAVVGGINIDKTRPTTSATLTGAAGSGGWYRGAVAVTLAATDNLAGVRATYYATDGGPARAYGGSFPIAGDGVHTLSFWSVDRADNEEAHQSRTIRIDAAPPTIAGSRTPAANADGWNNTDVVVRFAAADGQSGLATVTSPVTLRTEGAGQSAVGTAVDVAGNRASATVSGINIDKARPTTSATPDGPAGAGGWYRGAVAVSLAAADNLAGVLATYYALDGGPARAYGGPIAVVGDGSHALSYWSVDRAGNEEAHQSRAIRIDAAAPAIAGSRTPAANADGWSNTDVVVSFTAADAVSGVSSVTAPVTLSGEGRGQSVAGTAADAAGNVATAVVGGINIDRTRPTTSATASGPAGTDGWYRGDVTVALDADDRLAGMRATYYVLDGGPIRTYGGPIAVDGDGVHALSYWSVDRADNEELRHDLAIRIDAVRPTVVVAGPASGQATNRNPTVAGAVTDDHSGAASLEAAVDDGAYAGVTLDAAGQFQFATSLPLDGGADGPHTVHLRGADRAGNLAVAELSFTLDSQIATPATDLSAASDTGAPGDRTTGAGSVTLVGRTDPGATVTLRSGGAPVASALASGSGTFQLVGVPLAMGSNAFTVHAVDPVGNAGDFGLTLTRGAPEADRQDVVLRWNQAALDAIRLGASAPPVATRALAMVGAAVFDAVSAIEGTPGYLVELPAPSDASPEAAVAAAAHVVLAYLYPAQQATFDATLTASLAQVSAGPSRDAGVAFGRAVGQAVIALRADDGATRFVDYMPGTGPGAWQPTAPMFAEALLPQWAAVTPFALSSPDQFRPAPAPPLGSAD